MDLVGCVGIPDDQLAVLRSRNQMSSIRGPVHSVDLCKMALQDFASLHADSRQSISIALGDAAYYNVQP